MTLNTVLKLDRPLVCLDVETHAKLPPEKGRICELGFKIFYPDDRPPKAWESLIDPTVPIDSDATTVHGITDTDVFGKPRFQDLAENLLLGFNDCDFCGYNIRFDLRAIHAEMLRAGKTWSYENARLIDALRIWQVGKPRTLSDAVREFCGREPTDAHRALADTEDAIDATVGMLERFTEMPRTVQALHDLCFKDAVRIDAEGKFQWMNGKPCIAFGKHSGTPINRLDPNYLQWILKSDFPPDTKKIVDAALRGVFPTK